MREIYVRAHKTYVDDEGVLWLVNLVQRQQTLDDAKAVVAAARSLCEPTRRPMLLDLSVPASHTNEARAYYSSPESCVFLTALGIVTASTLGRVVGSIIMSLQRAPVPHQMFSATGPALAWLKMYRLDQKTAPLRASLFRRGARAGRKVSCA